MDTSWNKVAGWYDSHLKGASKKTYHETVVIPGLIKLLNIHVKRGGTVADLACGQGLVTREIGRAGYIVKGVDIAPDLIAIAKKDNATGIEFYVDDISNLNTKTINQIGAVDCVTIVLAIQNIENLEGVFYNAAKLLKPNGRLLLVMNHPYFRIPGSTSWGFDGNKTQYRRVDAYMSPKKIPIEMTPGDFAKAGKSKLTWSFHRPLSAYIKAMNKFDFSLLDMEEWISDKVSEPGVRAKAENTARKEIPLFMALIAGL